jgi:hypothetical protein
MYSPDSHWKPPIPERPTRSMLAANTVRTSASAVSTPAAAAPLRNDRRSDIVGSGEAVLVMVSPGNVVDVNAGRQRAACRVTHALVLLVAFETGLGDS